MNVPFKSRSTLAIALVTALTIGVSAPASAAMRSAENVSAATATYDGPTLFDAIFFNTGPGAALLPAERPTMTSEGAAALTSTIDRTDPTFFHRFAADIHSGDRVAIRAALEEGRGKLLALASLQDPLATAYVNCDLIVGYIWIVIDFIIVTMVDFDLYQPCDTAPRTDFDRRVLQVGGSLTTDALVDVIAKVFAV